MCSAVAGQVAARRGSSEQARCSAAHRSAVAIAERTGSPVINPLVQHDDDDADLLSRSFYCPTAAVVQLLPACPPLLCKVLTCPFCSMDWPPPCQLTHLCCSVAAACWTPLLCQIRTCSFCSKIERRRVCCRIRCCSVTAASMPPLLCNISPAPASLKCCRRRDSCPSLLF